MKKIELKDVKPYQAPGHFNMTAMRLQGKEETGATKFWMGLSNFLPGGGAEWGYEDNPFEKVYFVLEGEITVTTPDKHTYMLKASDSLYVGPNEARAIINNTRKSSCRSISQLRCRRCQGALASRSCTIRRHR